ncbi:MAG: hypothetical protein DWI02_07530 [Planctomycetota bacterium]|nr:MAG: hypothetical protein DWI02_07530 [Planctomycetota bacterium]
MSDRHHGIGFLTDSDEEIDCFVKIDCRDYVVCSEAVNGGEWGGLRVSLFPTPKHELDVLFVAICWLLWRTAAGILPQASCQGGIRYVIRPGR